MADSGKKFEGAGGTPGGIVEFLFGLVLTIAGGYLLLDNVQVHTSGWRLFGMANGFGISLIPLVLGIGILFFNGRSAIGWVLAGGGMVVIIVGIIAQMDIYFRPTSLFHTLIMLGLLAAGLGLIARSVRPHGRPAATD
jgi:hypothetical protein